MWRLRDKWRPRFSQVVVAILLTVLALPLASLFFFRIYENQLLRQTEAELIAQGAAISAFYASAMRADPGFAARPLGATVVAAPADPALGRYRPVEPRLDLAKDPILPPRPEPTAVNAPSAFAPIGATLQDALSETQRATLAGFRLLDPLGIVIAGGDELGMSLAHVEEVAAALGGQYRSVLRQRISDEPAPPLYSISRGTRVRIFVATPVLIGDQVAGVVYLSRTPSNIVKVLYEERSKLVLAAATMLLATALVGFIFVRTVSWPIRELRQRTKRIALGDATALAPLRHGGTRELAELANSFLDMANELNHRSDAIRTFATHLSHELKSPLTAIQGAAETLRDEGDAMDAAYRAHFLGNIVSDAQRLDQLLKRLMELARAENFARSDETSTLSKTVADFTAPIPLALELQEGADIPLRISSDQFKIVLSNLADNAARHEATRLSISARNSLQGVIVRVSDDGSGISAANRNRVFEPFFTTRRSSGGTGLGLGIVAAVLKSNGGTICLGEEEPGEFRDNVARSKSTLNIWEGMLLRYAGRTGRGSVT